MALTIAVNADTADLVYDTSGVDWVDVNLANDYLVFSSGSATVADGETVPSSSDLVQAGVVLDGTQQIVPYYFLADYSANLLKQIHNAGNQNKRYVFAFSFDGTTASEPVLEVWDDANMTTITTYTLGSGTASSSWVRGVTTTAALPGTNWTGTRLAGSADGYFLYLNNGSGPLSAADVLYCNLKIIIPSTATVGASESPVFVCKYTTN